MDQSPIWRRLQSCMASMPVPESHAESHAVRNEPGDPMSCILGLTTLSGFLDTADAVRVRYGHTGSSSLPGLSQCPRRITHHTGSAEVTTDTSHTGAAEVTTDTSQEHAGFPSMHSVDAALYC